MATKSRKLVLVTGQPVVDPAEAAAESGDFQGEAAVEQVPEEAVAVVKKSKVARKAVKSETVKTKADTIDAEEAKTVAGKAQTLNAAKVLEIIVLSDAGTKPSEIAKQFGVHPSHVSNIIRGVSWSHVTNRHYTKKGGK